MPTIARPDMPLRAATQRLARGTAVPTACKDRAGCRRQAWGQARVYPRARSCHGHYAATGRSLNLALSLGTYEQPLSSLVSA